MPQAFPERSVAPVMVVPQAVPCWDGSEAARLITDPGLSVDTAHRQIRRFAQEKWIPVARHRGTGPKAANLYAPAAVAAAKVLSVLTDLGIEDHATMGLASVNLFAWNSDQPIVKAADGKSYGSPIVAAMMRAESPGEWWAYQLRLLRGDQTGTRHVRSWVYNPDKWNPSAEEAEAEMLPRAAVTIHLRPVLLPLYHRMAESVGVVAAGAH